MNENVMHIVRHPATKLVAVGVGSFGLGLFAGYIIGEKRVKALSPEEKEQLIEIGKSVERSRQQREHRKMVVDEEELKLLDDLRLEEGKKPADPVEENTWEDPAQDEPVRRNVFAESSDAEDVWDYEAEKRNRDSTTPYVLHKDEFYADEMDFHQHTYVYYEGDDIMADEEDKPVYNYSTILGELKFGHGSGDEKVVYIRNESRKEEYEVIKDPGLFSVEILGLEIEQNDRVRNNRDLEHSVLRRFREPE